jgi:hypothetical protein
MRTHQFGILRLAFGVAVAISLTGCATSLVAEKASAHYSTDSDGKRFDETPAEPAWYFLLPASVPFDIATSPFQAFVALAMQFHWFGTEGL